MKKRHTEVLPKSSILFIMLLIVFLLMNYLSHNTITKKNIINISPKNKFKIL